jgi:general L-amino acid transport system permease protein
MATEAYVFAGAGFWVFCFAMSRYSIHLERKLGAGQRRR